MVGTDVPGLICRITCGGARNMAVKGRIKGGGATFRISLGEYTLRPIDDWRTKARAIMARARDGVDPRVQNSDDQTFAEARDRYLGNPPLVSRGSRAGQPWSDAYLSDTTRYLTHNVDELEKLKLRHVTGAHMVAATSSIKTTSLRRAAHASLSAFFHGASTSGLSRRLRFFR